MTTTLAQPTLSPQDLRRLEREPGLELIHGQFEEKPMSAEAGETGATIIGLFFVHVRKTKSARIFDSSVGYRCFPDDPMHFRKPDVSVIRAERAKEIEPREGFVTIPPDLAVEVLSPGDMAYGVTEKVDEYLKNGFPLVWIVQPNIKAVTVHRADGSVSMLHENDEITGESALPEFKCKVGEFFSA